MFVEDSGSMDDCNAALILLKLSASPHSPQRKTILSTVSLSLWCNPNFNPFSSTPLVRQWKYGSSPASSSASWSSGSSSPPLSDDNNNNVLVNNRNRTASLSTSDEGIVMDLMPKKVSADHISILSGRNYLSATRRETDAVLKQPVGIYQQQQHQKKPPWQALRHNIMNDVLLRDSD